LQEFDYLSQFSLTSSAFTVVDVDFRPLVAIRGAASPPQEATKERGTRLLRILLNRKKETLMPIQSMSAILFLSCDFQSEYGMEETLLKSLY
jgi:hypothetical protein